VPKLRIPPDEQTGLVQLQALSAPAASKLLSAIKAAASKTDTDGLTVADLPEIPEVSRPDVEQILNTVVALYHVRAFSDVELDEFIADVCEFLSSEGRKDFSRAKGAMQQLRERLTEFLGIEDLNRAAKSTALRYEQERSVHSVRILTDARPVFGNDIRELPEAVVILHTLKIEYHHAGRLGETFFAFDERDLEELKKAIQRAELKATSLRSALAKAKVKVFNLK
jgi:hypothetical protein